MGKGRGETCSGRQLCPWGALGLSLPTLAPEAVLQCLLLGRGSLVLREDMHVQSSGDWLWMTPSLKKVVVVGMTHFAQVSLCM